MDQVPIRHAATAEAIPKNPTRDEFRRWVARQPRGRYERVWGEVVAMSPERIGHAVVKARVWRVLSDAIAAAGVQCQAFADGVTVEVGGSVDYEPDALVNCGPMPDLDMVHAPNPVVVVEVASPGTQAVDMGEKLSDYFLVPSIAHYLIVRPRQREVLHNRRLDADRIEARRLRSGAIMLDPPGITITVEDLFVDLPAA